MIRFISMFWTMHALGSFAGSGPTPTLTDAAAPPPVTAAVAPAPPAGFDPARAPFAIRFGDRPVPYGVTGVFALPGEVVALEAPAADSGLRAEADGGELVAIGPGRWTWRAPAAPGATALRVVRGDSGESVTLNAFVLVPYEEMKAGKVRGYAVGAYPAPRARHAERDRRPHGFVEVTAATADLQVSPHFRLGQFLCKSGSAYPKYVVLQPALIDRLEGLLAALNAAGVPARSFQVMSAYRTPSYNRAIGNSTTFTRHQYGDAADIFVDEDGDGRMDDLNRDGRHDRKDALVLHALAEATEGTAESGGRLGGLSAYAANHAHGPFVHVDTRGYRARW